MSSLETIAAIAGVVAVAASAGGIAAVVSAIRSEQRVPPLSSEGPREAEGTENNHERIPEETGRPRRPKDGDAAARLKDIDFPGLTEQLGEIREASDAAARLKDIDFPGLTEQLGEIREASDAAARLKHIDIPGLTEQLGEIREASDAAARLKHIDIPGLTEQLGEIREARGAHRRVEIRARDNRDVLSLSQIADQLAIVVGAQWEAEAAIRRLNDPYPLPVSWAPADADLADTWDSVVTLAASGAGWPQHPPVGTWAGGPEELSGEGGELAAVLARVPTGRLAVLGEPGAGKTMLMVRLVLDLLARRVSGGPVPILVSVASWNPASQDLRDWLESQLLIDHPALASPPPGGMTGHTRAAALLAAGLIVPLLDGLDEIPEELRGPAISRINDELRPGQNLVVTCRTEQFRVAVRPLSGAEVTLRAAAAIQLRPLDADTVRRYLRDDAPGPSARARWDPVLATLGTRAPVAQVLRTPLMVGLARAIYSPRPGELTGSLHDPAELLSPDLRSRAAVESLLFDAFVPAVYRQDSSRRRWTAPEAERWLTFLARHLERIGTPDIAWWQLTSAISRNELGLIGGFVGILAGFISGALIGWMTGGIGTAIEGALAGGLVLGLLFGLRFRTTIYRRPARGVRWKLTRGIPAALLTGLAAGFAIGLVDGFGAGLAAGFTGGLFGAAIGITNLSADLVVGVSPISVLKRDIRTAFVFGTTFGILGGLAFGLWAWFAVGVAAGLAYGVVGGFIFGMASGLVLSDSAWLHWAVAHSRLALGGKLPWASMRFLADAHKRGILRQIGAVYQFRHIELQHRLASRSERSHSLRKHL